MADLAQNPPAGNLAVISCDLGPVAALAATAVAAAIVGDELADLRLPVPDGDRWTVAEVTDQLIGGTRLVPVRRNVIVVPFADQMGPGCADHLLKTIEEPSAPSLFLFAVTDPELLLTTIRGRASVEVAVETIPATERAAALAASAGIAQEAALRLVTLAGQQVTLAQVPNAVAADQVLEELEAGFGPELGSPAPVTTATGQVAAFEQLAKRITKAAGERSAPAVRRAVRTLARQALDAWEAAEPVHVADAIRAQDTGRVHDSYRRLAAIGRARAELALNAPVPAVLAAVHARAGGPVR